MTADDGDCNHGRNEWGWCNNIIEMAQDSRRQILFWAWACSDVLYWFKKKKKPTYARSPRTVALQSSPLLQLALEKGAGADAVAWQVKTSVHIRALGLFQVPRCFYEIVNDHRLLEAYLLAHAGRHSSALSLWSNFIYELLYSKETQWLLHRSDKWHFDKPHTDCGASP